MAKYKIEMKSVSTNTSHNVYEGWADVLVVSITNW